MCSVYRTNLQREVSKRLAFQGRHLGDHLTRNGPLGGQYGQGNTEWLGMGPDAGSVRTRLGPKLYSKQGAQYHGMMLCRFIWHYLGVTEHIVEIQIGLEEPLPRLSVDGIARMGDG